MPTHLEGLIDCGWVGEWGVVEIRLSFRVEMKVDYGAALALTAEDQAALDLAQWYQFANTYI